MLMPKSTRDRAFFHISIAIINIALCAVSISARAQNGSENLQLAEQIERQRISSERAVLLTQQEQQRQDCYQKLAVSPCLNEVRDQHNGKMQDLKRQEVALSDVQRKRKAADRLRAVDDRHSPQALQNLAEQRGRALEASARREEERAQRERSREAKLVQANVPSVAASGIASAATPAASQEKKILAGKKANTASGERSGDAAKMQRSSQQAAERERAATERRAKSEQREANRKKPAATSLPVPAS